MKQDILKFLIFVSGAVLANGSSIGPRIIGGEPARAGQFPFAAAINVRTATYALFCGGSLIHQQWILTAGQCVVNATEFSIQLGSNSLNESDLNRLIISTSTYILHPEFNPLTLENDIGLIKLRMPVTQTDYIRTVYLGATNLLEGTKTTAVGWGQISDDVAGPNNALNYVSLTVLSNTECKLVYGDQLVHDMVCLSGNFNEGTCIDDTGSPLISSLFHLNWVLAVSSFYSGNGCESTDPSGYTRIAPFVDWINNQISSK